MRINDVILRGVNMSSLDLFNIDTMDTFGNRVNMSSLDLFNIDTIDTFGNRGGSSHSLSDQEVFTDDVIQQGDYTETELKNCSYVINNNSSVKEHIDNCVGVSPSSSEISAGASLTDTVRLGFSER